SQAAKRVCKIRTGDHREQALWLRVLALGVHVCFKRVYRPSPVRVTVLQTLDRQTIGPTSSSMRAAKLGLSTVGDFGKERRLVSEEAVKAIQTALQRAGIEFLDENGVGEGVLLRKRQKRT